MDAKVVTMLEQAGIDTASPEFLRVPTVLGEEGRVLPLVQELPVPVLGIGDQVVWVPLQPISQLWVGSKIPPDFSFAPPPEYEPFFILLEATAADYCSATGRPERDKEFERLYRHLRRRPDGQDANPLFFYLQAAARLYLSLCDVSQAEFEAVVNRLRRSAKTFSLSLISTNYHRLVLEEHLFYE
ncbi:hypothetical protein [Stigmatella aurantiaca]|uniref:Conserved uncharacterized protein n=1 Tax=Stigmatella aurantiaca (strain DW4/3-1) TaxID=378806 RepID=Q09DU2_STIAD|nr:hypothetical protein [Stigmatella aurantiaca]ADO75221.1 conserved uncharacterized protein [Stigmatella aurantiaca DW4/3-1]EAU69941.1 hypothetical protein STIAU_5583 [Stigmatella aurantiaca DW4/3-1]